MRAAQPAKTPYIYVPAQTCAASHSDPGDLLRHFLTQTVTSPCERHWIDACRCAGPMSQSVNSAGIGHDSRYTTAGNDAIVLPDFGVRVSFRGSVGESLGVSEVGTQPALHPVHAS